MIIAIYLFKSILAMSILLAVYKIFLEKEKMHQFNRMYLIAAILLSLLVPVLPTGLSMDRLDSPEITQLLTIENTGVVTSVGPTIEQDYIGFDNLISMLYFAVFIFLGIKFSRNIFELIRIILKYEKRGYKEAKIILLDKIVTPFTFMNYIFLSKNEFEGQNIDKQLIDHELAHVRQRHSLDVLFIELIITIFWFNPILRWYKTAIQLNHEFLADEAVINKYHAVKIYQYLLLDTIQNNNKISLASNINFHLTQKRLEMMTKKSSSKKKKVLILSTIPLIFGLLLFLGNPAISQNIDSANKKEVQKDINIQKDKYFEHAIIHYKTNNGTIKVLKYESLSSDAKAKIPPPPPTESGLEIQPLPKGAIVYVSEDGRILKSNEKMGNIPPPPPKPPSPNGINQAPEAPMPPAARSPRLEVQPAAPAIPPPPPPIPSIKELVKEGATIYIDGKLASAQQVKELSNENSDNVESIRVIKGNDGKKSVYIVKK